MLTSDIGSDTVASENSSFNAEIGITIDPDDPYDMPDKEMKLRHLKLYRAALDGDWKKAKRMYEKYENYKTARISKEGDTALHIAVAAGRTDYVKKLVEGINKDNFGMRNKAGSTPFCLAAVCGSVELAKVMMDTVKKQDSVTKTEVATVKEERRNSNDNKIETSTDLAMIRGRSNMLPLETAALFGHKDMVKFLYKVTDVKSLNPSDQMELLVNLISTGIYDVALDMVKKNPLLATDRDSKEETALHALARMPIANQQGFWKRCFNLCSNILRNKKDPVAVQLVKHLWEKIIVLEDSKISEFIGIPSDQKLIFVAAEHGNIEFLSILIRKYPDLLFKVDENNYTIFHHAVKNRHNDIFKLIYRIGSSTNLIAPYKDKEGNNILHLAGMLAPPDRLNIVSGAALQMQRELLCFKEVSKIMNPLDAKDRNNKGKTPRALFTDEHRMLKEDGEKWMKGTAKSCMIVAALIATVVFAAAFTVPGSTKQDAGTPNFLLENSFTIFAISDAISLVSSSSSILAFLSILTSRYAEEDFLWRLPTKLLIGLLTLSISVAAMMVVFCATFFIVFNDGKRWCAFVVIGISPVPVILFSILHIRLAFDIGRSTMLLLSSYYDINRLFPSKWRKQRNLRKGSKYCS